MATVLVFMYVFAIGCSVIFDTEATNKVHPFYETTGFSKREIGDKIDPDKDTDIMFTFGDKDNNGQLSQNEVRDFIVNHSGSSTEDATHIAQMHFIFGDENHDGVLTRQELLHVLKLFQSMEQFGSK